MPKSNLLDRHAQRVSTLPEDMLLGFLIWYTIPSELRIPHREFELMLKKYALDLPGSVPNEPRGADVYRRAIKEYERTSEVTRNRNVENFLIRPMRAKHQIVREELTPRGRRLSYKVLATLSYDSPTETIIIEPLEENDRWYWKAEEISRNVRSYFRSWRHCIGDNAVRAFLREVLYQWDATCVRPSGGVYFLMSQHQAGLGALTALIQELWQKSGTRTTLDVIPIPNDQNQKAMLRLAFEDEATNEVEKMIGEISEILAVKDRQVTGDTWEKFHVRFLNATRRTSDYSEMLEDNLDRVTSALEILKTYMPVLADRIM